ncbi:MAG: alpha/beta fold hydrolase [Taibaiella sp.]|jgi:pimeloyl-ACP methyl ester carboxylesterase
MRNLILLHGALGHSSNFEPYERYLSEHFRVHKILFHGHGDTSIPTEGIYMSGYVEQLHRYCEEHTLEEVHIFGYSMGGYVALSYALKYPGRVSSILTLATKLNWTEEGAIKESKMLNPDVIADKIPKYATQLATLHGTEQWKTLLPAIAGMMIDLGKKPLLTPENYAHINARVQLMIGDKDVMVTLDETLQAAKAIPEARLAVLPNTKHPIEQVRAKLLLGLMKDFWAL